MSKTWSLSDEKPSIGSLLPRDVINRQNSALKDGVIKEESDSQKERLSTLKSNTLKEESSSRPSIVEELRTSNLNTLLLVDRFQYRFQQKKNIAKDADGKFYSNLYSKTKHLRSVLIILSIALIFITKPCWCEFNPKMSVSLLNLRKTAVWIEMAINTTRNSIRICHHICLF